MPSLAKELRNTLARVTLAARTRALLLYFEEQVYARLQTNRPVRAAFDAWLNHPANLYQLRITKLFAGRGIRRDLATEIDAFLRPHRFP